MKKSIVRLGIQSSKSKIIFGMETLEELDERLSARKSPNIVIIDSIQLLKVRTSTMSAFINKHKHKKLLIFISQVNGKTPRGEVAQDIRYIASQKIWVEGFRAISLGRSNAGGYYTIWEEGAAKYWELNKN